jgi:hypothetical protein
LAQRISRHAPLPPQSISGLQEADDLIFTGSVCCLAALLPLLCRGPAASARLPIEADVLPTYVGNRVPHLGTMGAKAVQAEVYGSSPRDPSASPTPQSGRDIFLRNASMDSLDQEVAGEREAAAPTSAPPASVSISSSGTASGTSAHWAVSELVEKLLVPNAIHIAISPSQPKLFKRSVVAAMVRSWKQLCHELPLAKVRRE